jgi:DNA-binding MarR family transcriptional regulator
LRDDGDRFVIDNEIIEHFLNSLEKFYTFLRPHSPRPRTTVNKVGKINKNQELELDMWHFSALIIISLLTNKGEKPCLQDELAGVFLWKYRDGKSKFVDKNNGVLNVLEACNFIKKGHYEDDRRRKTIILTDEGNAFIDEELRKSRRKDVLTIISQLGIRDAEKYPYAKVSEGLTTLADNLWVVVLAKAKELQEEEKANKKLKQKLN